MEYTENGQSVKKRLDFYEIPVELEKNSKYNIIGVANIVHMREVSKKRLNRTPVAKITKDNFIDIGNAVIRNINFVNNH